MKKFLWSILFLVLGFVSVLLGQNTGPGGAGVTSVSGDGVLETGTITGSGSLVLGTCAAHTVWCNTSGSTATPAFSASPQLSTLSTTSTATVGGRLTATAGIESSLNNQNSPTSITVTASPFTYNNSATTIQFVYIFGGTISAFSINAVSMATGLTVNQTEMFELQSGESVTVTYSAAPVMWSKSL
jgi:hypothetical protein